MTRASFFARISASAAIPLLTCCSVVAATTKDLSDAEIEGRNLVQQLLQQRPTENFTNSGVLKIRASRSKRSGIPFKFEIIVTPANWLSVYETLPASNIAKSVTLTVAQDGVHPNRYTLVERADNRADTNAVTNPAGAATMISFAGSDFWLADLGLEFFHWPEQKILKHEMRRGQACKVLESTNPDPSTNGYSRIVSWIDNDTGGIVHADAYDAHGKLLKQFEPKEFKKVHGQWQLQEMEICNVQTGSRTRIEFTVDNK